jgi:hypothetical protein
MQRFDVTVRGIAPLLMHRFPDDALPGGGGGATPSAMKVDHGSPEAQAEKAAYRMDGEGSELYIPGEAFYQCLVKSGTEFKVPGARGKTYKDTMKGLVSVIPDYIGLGVTEFEVDGRNARVQGKACRRYRPLLREWECSFQIEALDETLKAILDRAGQTKGVLDYRPRFGRFIVTRFEFDRSAS